MRAAHWCSSDPHSRKPESRRPQTSQVDRNHEPERRSAATPPSDIKGASPLYRGRTPYQRSRSSQRGPSRDLRFTLAQMRAPGHLRPKRLPKKLEFPFAFAISSALCLPSHHCEAGTIARTASMCWPQPAHVVLPHTLHFTGLHMLFSLVSRTLVRRCSILSNPSPDSARLLRSSASPSRASD